MTALTERQRKFAEYYVQCGNAEQAAVSAGYSEQYARGNAYKLVATVALPPTSTTVEAAQTAHIMTARGGRSCRPTSPGRGQRRHRPYPSCGRQTR
ncbi:MAG: terminase small subunit [Ruminococcus callidus]